MRFGVISNPRSRAHLEGRADLGVTAASLPHASPGSRQALHEALAGFAAEGVGLLVVNGGDGTLREVLSALPAAWPGAPPAIAPLAAGRTNLMAHALDQSGKGEAALQRLLAAAAGHRLRWQARPVIEVSRPGAPSAEPLRGLLFGAAAFTEAIRLAGGTLNRRSLKDNAAVGVTAALMAAQALSGRGARGQALRRGVMMQVMGDEAAHPRFMLLATTLDRLMFGLWPFWGGGEGAIRWLDVAAPPHRLSAGLWSLLRRRPPGLPGWRSGRSERLQIGLDQPFVLDGELFDPGPAGVVLTASAPIRFAAP